ncbi:MAG: DUF4168 domain-containing protein [Acetobacteraceae bacterium]|nr:DUF4168 domain-containing protein [Acetobacteraceae bacterium]
MESAFGKALGAAVLVAALGLAAAPLGAQQAPPATTPMAEQGTQAGGAQVPEATVQRAGAAIRDLSGIQARYTQRMQGAQPAEHQAIAEEAAGAAEAALAAQGLTVDEYNSVIRLAQADQSLRERLISAARGAR